MADTPPVCIFVCNNTSVSKEVFKYVAGYAQEAGSDGESEQSTDLTGGSSVVVEPGKKAPVGGLSYRATYNGSDIYNPSTGACEPLDATVLTPGVTTDIHNGSDSVVKVVEAPATVHDSVPYLKRLDRQRERSGFGSRRWDWMPATRRRPSRKAWRSAVFMGLRGTDNRIMARDCSLNASSITTPN